MSVGRKFSTFELCANRIKLICAVSQDHAQSVSCVPRQGRHHSSHSIKMAQHGTHRPQSRCHSDSVRPEQQWQSTAPLGRVQYCDLPRQEASAVTDSSNVVSKCTVAGQAHHSQEWQHPHQSSACLRMHCVLADMQQSGILIPLRPVPRNGNVGWTRQQRSPTATWRRHHTAASLRSRRPGPAHASDRWGS